MNHRFQIEHPRPNIDPDEVIHFGQLLESRLNEGFRPRLGIICGSGWKGVGELLDNPTRISMRELGLPVPMATGHGSDILAGTISGLPVLVVTGRVHCYDGWHPRHVTLMVKVLARLGVGSLIITNAAGGLMDPSRNFNPTFRVGQLALMTDIVMNPSALSPLEGPNDDDLGPRFPAMNQLFDTDFQNMAEHAARDLPQDLAFEFQRGRYLMMNGPTYESVATIQNFIDQKTTDFVGMSTVPELVMARYFGMKILGFTLISNLAAGIGGSIPEGEEVVLEGKKALPRVNGFARALIGRADFQKVCNARGDWMRGRKIFTMGR